MRVYNDSNIEKNDNVTEGLGIISIIMHNVSRDFCCCCCCSVNIKGFWGENYNRFDMK